MSITSLVIALGVLLLGVVLLSGFILYIYWWLIQRPTARYDGTFTVEGLGETVEVLRDRYGIPHIRSQNEADLWRAQGFVHAQDRLWQMEQNRRIGYGTLAEVFGETAIEADRFSRIIGFARAAAAEAAQLDEETRAALQAYVDGVNGFITTNRGRLSAEFNLLRVDPSLWRVEDVLTVSKVMAWGLSVNWESELNRLLLVAQLGPLRAAELEPDYPATSPIILEGVGSQEVTRLLSTAGLLLNEYDKVKAWIGAVPEGKGSNSWVLSPRHTQTRRAMLANDPHLAVQIPGVWFENHLTCPTLDVTGVSMPGMPGVMIGHNAHIGWGIANAFVDQQDLYMERAHPQEPNTFETADGWEAATVLEETIHVRRRSQPVVERVVITRHGPLISGLIVGDVQPPTPLALRWVGHMPGQTARALLKLNRARNWAEFQAALADWSVPAQAVTYADVDGNIGFVLAGAVPGRRYNLGLVPAAGWDGKHEWDGLVPPHELPRLFNPPSGRIVTANNKIAGDDYHHFLGVDFLPGWRAARIEEMLTEKERYSLRDMMDVQLDTTSGFAAALAPLFAQLDSDDPWIKVATTTLRRWNYRMDADSPAAMIFHYALICLLEEVFGSKLGAFGEHYSGTGRSPLFLINGVPARIATRVLEIVTQNQTSAWYADVKTGRERSREEVLYAALARATRRLRADLGDNVRRWEWGRAHQVRYVHPLGSVRLFRGLFNRGPFPVGGDLTTPNQTFSGLRLPLPLVQVTASYRQVLDVGEWDACHSVTTTGQSGHPMSQQYADQMGMWLEGEYHPMPWTSAAQQEAAHYRARLVPGARGDGEEGFPA